jgi:hypothetical protein
MYFGRPHVSEEPVTWMLRVDDGFKQIPLNIRRSTGVQTVASHTAILLITPVLTTSDIST